jgi:hypothetical protein
MEERESVYYIKESDGRREGEREKETSLGRRIRRKRKRIPPLSRPYSFKFQRYSQRSLFLINTSPSFLSLSHYHPT